MLPADIERPSIEGHDAFIAQPGQPGRPAVAVPGGVPGLLPQRALIALDVLDALPERDENEIAFRFGLVISHENQHDEPCCRAINLRPGPVDPQAADLAAAGRSGQAARRCLVPGGPFVLGVDPTRTAVAGQRAPGPWWTYRPSGSAGCRSPTEWRRFIDDGGYRQPRWWSARVGAPPAGRPETPQFWNADGSRTRFGRVEDIPMTNPSSTSRSSRPRRTRKGRRAAADRDRGEKACAWDPVLGAAPLPVGN